jgi:hypothetical protein
MIKSPIAVPAFTSRAREIGLSMCIKVALAAVARSEALFQLDF